MKNLKNKLAAIAFTLMIAMGSTVANAGILINDRNGSGFKNTETCTTSEDQKDWGILINDIIGILINDLGGILINDLKDSAPTNCGILIND